jgi:hypothetical protein
MIEVPTGQRELVAFANEMIETCRVSQGPRAAYYRLLNTIAETGTYDGTKALINMMNTHLERTQSHLFSPVELKFAIDYDNDYEPGEIKRGEVAAKHLTRQWEKTSTDMLFGQGVFEGLKYGAAMMKQWPKVDHKDADGKEVFSYEKKLVMPWNFGVWREDENDIDNQEALCETSTLTGPELWRRIWNFPKADQLYKDIMVHAHSGSQGDSPDSFFHQVLSTSQINTGVQASTRPLPGGIVQLNSDPNYGIMGPTVGAPVVRMHELWIKGDDDYKVVQMVEPDMLLSRFKLSNLLGIERLQPYRLIQANPVAGWFWGKSELVDLIEPQGLLSQWAADIKRLFGLQIDKILGFSGDNTITDENYGQMRMAGYFNLGMNGKAEDLTPEMPPNAIEMLKFCIEMINTLGSFPEIMQGKGESGVRAGVHANTLLKTASPTLRDRALLSERQCARCADLTLTMMEAKEDRKFWTDPKQKEETAFMLTDLPSDWRVTVDSHSSSPIFSDESLQLIMALRKTGDVDGEYVIDNTPLPNKEAAKAALKQRKAAGQQMQEKLMEQLSPEGKDKAIEKIVGGHGKH